MKRILLTGGAGFIGSHLSERLLKKGFVVFCIDNLLTGSKANIEALFPNDNFGFIDHDVTNFVEMHGDLDYVLHFASPASPIDYLKFPIKTLKVGSLGTHKTLGLAKAKGAKYMLASTSEVYGDPLVHPQPEDYWGNVNPIGPRGVYDEAKRFAEALTLAYHRTHGIDTKIARIFNTYGPRMRPDDGRAIPAFISQALDGRPITVFGDGSQTRSFCFIDDTIDGLVALMESNTNEPVNVGNRTEMSILELAKLIIRLTKSRSKVVHKPLPQNDPKVRQPDLSRAKKMLKWEPRIGLDEGLKITIEWFKGRKRGKGV